MDDRPKPIDLSDDEDAPESEQCLVPFSPGSLTKRPQTGEATQHSGIDHNDDSQVSPSPHPGNQAGANTAEGVLVSPDDACSNLLQFGAWNIQGKPCN